MNRNLRLIKAIKFMRIDEDFFKSVSVKLKNVFFIFILVELQRTKGIYIELKSNRIKKA